MKVKRNRRADEDVSNTFRIWFKVVVTGDITQTGPSKEYTFRTCKFTRSSKSIEDIGFVEFQTKDVIRHGLVQKIVEAYARFLK